MAEADVARAMFEVLKTIAACHANNFYHGDIKPANFMLKDQPSKIGPHGPTFERYSPTPFHSIVHIFNWPRVCVQVKVCAASKRAASNGLLPTGATTQHRLA